MISWSMCSKMKICTVHLHCLGSVCELYCVVLFGSLSEADVWSLCIVIDRSTTHKYNTVVKYVRCYEFYKFITCELTRGAHRNRHRTCHAVQHCSWTSLCDIIVLMWCHHATSLSKLWCVSQCLPAQDASNSKNIGNGRTRCESWSEQRVIGADAISD